MNLLLAVGLVMQNHVSGCAPEMRANGSQGHVGRAELGRKDQHVKIKKRVWWILPSSGNTARDTPRVPFD